MYSRTHQFGVDRLQYKAGHPGIIVSMLQMEENSSEDINRFIQIFSKLSSKSRREAIRELISTLDSDELDMIIEVIDNKIDDTAARTGEAGGRDLVTDHLEDSGVSSISPSETTCDKVRLRWSP